MRLNFCVFCGTAIGIEHHHLVPLSFGGTDTEDNILSVCGTHHGLLHGVRRTPDIRALTVAGLNRAKARGVKLGSGNPRAGGRRLHELALERAREHEPAVRAALAGAKTLTAAATQLGWPLSRLQRIMIMLGIRLGRTK